MNDMPNVSKMTMANYKPWIYDFNEFSIYDIERCYTDETPLKW